MHGLDPFMSIDVPGWLSKQATNNPLYNVFYGAGTLAIVAFFIVFAIVLLGLKPQHTASDDDIVTRRMGNATRICLTVFLTVLLIASVILCAWYTEFRNGSTSNGPITDWRYHRRGDFQAWTLFLSFWTLVLLACWPVQRVVAVAMRPQPSALQVASFLLLSSVHLTVTLELGNLASGDRTIGIFKHWMWFSDLVLLLLIAGTLFFKAAMWAVYAGPTTPQQEEQPATADADELTAMSTLGPQNEPGTAGTVSTIRSAHG